MVLVKRRVLMRLHEVIQLTGIVGIAAEIHLGIVVLPGVRGSVLTAVEWHDGFFVFLVWRIHIF